MTETIGEILAHRRFEQCNVTIDRKLAHMLVFFSFIGLAITTSWAVLYLYGYEIMHALGKTPYPWLLGPSPYPLTDPVKWLGNVSAIMLVGRYCHGDQQQKEERRKRPEKAGIMTGSSSILFLRSWQPVSCLKCARLADLAVLAYLIYFAHLVVVFFLFAYAPFSKMAHMLYRATAMVFAKTTERDVEVK